MGDISMYTQYFNNWSYRALSDELILQELMLQHKVNEADAKEILDKYKKAKSGQKQTSSGFMVASIGSFLCMVSCILTLLGVLPEMRFLILYGFTSLGAVLIVAGLYLIFEG
jgi:exonuclease III